MSVSYITNFKPSITNKLNSNKIFFNKNNKNKIISKNFFLFLLLLKFNNKNNLNIKIFIKPFYKKFITLLRAPYRYKLSRHQFIVNRYFILFTININLQKLYIKNVNNLINFIKTFKKIYVWFESNIVFQHRVKIFINFFFVKFFNLVY